MGPHRDPPHADVLAPGFAIDPLSLWRFLVRSRIRTSLRGQPAGSAGAARGALERLEISRLSGLGTERLFSDWLTEATGEVQGSLPLGSFGWACKCLNMVLRDAVYNAYLRETWRLERLEA